MKEFLSEVTGFLIAIVFIFGVRYLFVTLMFELIAIAFNIAFSWKTALGIWAMVRNQLSTNEKISACIEKYEHTMSM